MKGVVVEGMVSSADMTSEDMVLDSLLDNVKETIELPVAYDGGPMPKKFKVSIAVEEVK